MDEIAPGVFVATSTVYLTTSTVVRGAGNGCLVIDPALTAADVAGLGTWLRARGLRAVVGWSTHPHWDHVLWSDALGAQVSRYATGRAVAAAERTRRALADEVAAAAPGHDLTLVGRLAPLPGTGDVIPWDGPEVRVVAHDAHAPGHGALFLPGPGILVAGDMLSDVEVPLLDLAGADGRPADAAAGGPGDPGSGPPDPFGAYRAGLGLLASLGSAGVRCVVPGHGHVGDRAQFRARVAADFRYLDLVEAGRDADDPRLGGPDADWLRAEHARQRELARAELGPLPA